MRIYVYRCNACQYEYEIKQNIKDKPISLCPSCHQRKCERLICEPIVISTGEPKTLGTLAEKNRKKMGKYELESKEHERKESNRKAGKTLIEEVSGGKRVEATDTPWYRKVNNTTPKQIQKMSQKQQKKFIFEGKT